MSYDNSAYSLLYERNLDFVLRTPVCAYVNVML